MVNLEEHSSNHVLPINNFLPGLIIGQHATCSWNVEVKSRFDMFSVAVHA